MLHSYMEWEVIKDDMGRWFWRLCGEEKSIIVLGTAPHDTKDACLAEIALIKSAAAAPVIEGK